MCRSFRLCLLLQLQDMPSHDLKPLLDDLTEKRITPISVGKAPEAQNRGGKSLKSRRKSARSRRISRRSARMSTRSARMSARYPCLSIEVITKILVRH
jgi:hypothetical protein